MTFHVVGGLIEDIEYWKNYSKTLDVDNLYFYGFVPPKETSKYLNSFDILLAPYEKKYQYLEALCQIQVNSCLL